VPGLCDALAQEGCRTILVTQKPRGISQQALLLPVSNRVETHLLDGFDWERWRFSFTPNLGQRLESVCVEAGPCVLHDHGLWLHMNHVAAVVTSRLGIKRVVSPRGTLEDWSLQYRSWKKRLAWNAYQLDDLKSASAFCATSTGEADAIRALGFTQPIAVIPNGITLPMLPETSRHDSEPRTVLFMSRIHPKKGLLDLVAAWSRAARPGWQLVIAGPDEGGYRRVVEEAARRAGLPTSLKFVGPVLGSAKHELLMSADIFVLPSYSENFGIVVGEALAYGVPAITTNVTPWEMLRSGRCGWWIGTGTLPLEQALLDAMSLSGEERSEMGQRGRALVERDFSWRSVANKHIDLYRWLLTASSRPSWILQ
jgi:glycosyltransferase involved in cell wall biosynthesis